MSIAVELNKAVDYAEKINVYNDGAVSVYCTGEKEFETILLSWKSLIDGAHEMPAFGVSLNSETLKAKESGLWAEFVFPDRLESNGMPYEKLLINIVKCSQGFNLIRYNEQSGYDGRCFYYDLVGKNMGEFFDVLLKL